MQTEGLVDLRTIKTSLKALRSTERLGYRLGPLAGDAAALPENLLSVVRLVQALTMSDSEEWAGEADLLEGPLAGYATVRSARQKLSLLVKLGILRSRWHGERGSVNIVTLTEDGSEALQLWYRGRGEAPPVDTRPPRQDQAIHHLLVVAACIEILDEQAGRLERLWGDEDLRSQGRQGRSMAPGVQDQAFPDGRLVYLDSNGQAQELDIEILVAKYTEKTIRGKYRNLDPKKTVYYAPTRRLCERVGGMGYPVPVLLT